MLFSAFSMLSALFFSLLDGHDAAMATFSHHKAARTPAVLNLLTKKVLACKDQ